MALSDREIELIESKLAFLEQANQELSDVIYRQQKELQELKDRVSILASGFEEFKVESREYTLKEEKPPHY